MPRWGRSAETLAAADLAMVNFESAITERGTPEAKTYHFRAPASALPVLAKSGVDVVSMANNHAVDYGPVGLQDSLAAAKRPADPGDRDRARRGGGLQAVDHRGEGRQGRLPRGEPGAGHHQPEVRRGPRQARHRVGAQGGPAGRRGEGGEGQSGRRGRLHALGHRGRLSARRPIQKGLAKKLADAGATAVVGTPRARHAGRGHARQHLRGLRPRELPLVRHLALPELQRHQA
ncbi:CapA family protein [Yinghuangia aomiensis]